MIRQIEKLQKLVNHLLGLCADSGADVVPKAPSLDSEEKKNERLGFMLLKMQDGELEQRYALRLEKWLLCDPKAMAYYVDFQHLTAMLHLHFNPNRLGKYCIAEQIGARP